MSHSDHARDVRRAIRHIARHGTEGSAPTKELERLADAGEAALPPLEKALGLAAPEHLAAAIHVARMLRARELADAIAGVALRQAAPLEAKIEAIETLRDFEIDIPDTVEETLRLARSFLDRPDAGQLDRVLALPDTWREPVIDAWLESGPVPDVSLLEAVLGREPKLDRRLIERLGETGSPEAVPVLRRLEAEADDKSTRKAVGRALHRLRSLGVESATRSEDAGEAFSLAIETDPRREARAWMTGIDGSGGRLLWLLTPSATGGNRLLEVVIDDVSGIRKAEAMSVTRKGFRNHVDRLRSNPAIIVVQADIDVVVDRLREAEELGREQGEEPPDDYRRWRESVGESLLAIEPSAPDRIREELDAEALRDDRELLQESVELLKQPAFGNWALLGPEARRAAEAVRRAETTDLVVDDEQRKQQIDQAIAGAADAFDATERVRYENRLEAMAEVLLVDRRRRDARLALAAGIGFTEVEDLYSSHPFARAVIQRGVLAEYQAVREQEPDADAKRSSSIVQP